MGEVRMLIDGELAEAGSGKRFANVNPATEEVLGEVTDADAADMDPRHRCGATRVRRHRLVDQQGVAQALPAAVAGRLSAEQEELRQELVAEVGYSGHDDLRRRNSTGRWRTR